MRHSLTKSLKESEKWSPSNSGGADFGIRKRTLRGWKSDKGGNPVASYLMRK